MINEKRYHVWEDEARDYLVEMNGIEPDCTFAGTHDLPAEYGISGDAEADIDHIINCIRETAEALTEELSVDNLEAVAEYLRAIHASAYSPIKWKTDARDLWKLIAMAVRNIREAKLKTVVLTRGTAEAHIKNMLIWCADKLSEGGYTFDQRLGDIRADLYGEEPVRREAKVA